MSNIVENETQINPPPNEFVYGAAAIGKIIGKRKYQAEYFLAQGFIKSARKIGGKWVAHVPTLRREFGAPE